MKYHALFAIFAKASKFEIVRLRVTHDFQSQ